MKNPSPMSSARQASTKHSSINIGGGHSFPSLSRDIILPGEDPKLGLISLNVSKLRANLQQFLHKYTDSWAYNIYFQDGIVDWGSYGYTRFPIDFDPNYPQSYNSLRPVRRVDVASACKPITAVAILKLLKANGLTLQTPIGKLFDIPKTWNWNISDPVKWNKVNFERLLGHRTNLSAESGNGDYLNVGDTYYGALSGGNAIADVFRYSNVNYAFLRVLAWRLLGNDYPPGFSTFDLKAAGPAFANYIRHHVLKPCGIVDAIWGPSGKLASPCLAYSYPNKPGIHGKGPSPSTILERFSGPRGLYLSLDELIQFHVCLHDATIVTPDELELMKTGFDNPDKEYGLGLEFSVKIFQKTGRHFGHSGDIYYDENLQDPNYFSMRTRMISIPSAKFHAAVWTNCSTQLDDSNGVDLRHLLSEWMDTALTIMP